MVCMVRLSDGNEYNIPKFPPLSERVAPIREKLLDLQDSLLGEAVFVNERRLSREMSAVNRLEKMIDRVEKFLDLPDLAADKRDEYYKELKDLNKMLEGRVDSLETLSDDGASLASRISRNALDCATWALTQEPNNLSSEAAAELVSAANAIEVVKAMFGFLADRTGEDADTGPLSLPEGSTSGAAG